MGRNAGAAARSHDLQATRLLLVQSQHELLQLADASHEAHASSIRGAITACQVAQGHDDATVVRFGRAVVRAGSGSLGSAESPAAR